MEYSDDWYEWPGSLKLLLLCGIADVVVQGSEKAARAFQRRADAEDVDDEFCRGAFCGLVVCGRVAGGRPGAAYKSSAAGDELFRQPVRYCSSTARRRSSVAADEEAVCRPVLSMRTPRVRLMD